MSEFPKVKKGDRVRVVVEGEVTYAYADVLEGGTTFDVGKKAGYFHYNAPELKSVEVLAPPVKVGDILGGSREELDALPAGTVIKRDGGYMPIYKHYTRGWLLAGRSGEYPPEEIVRHNSAGDLRVIALPQGEAA